MKKIAVSGAQTSGNLHLGNYLGFIKNCLKMQNDYQCFFFLADLHAITTEQDPQKLKNSILQVAAYYMAAGIDPQKSVIFAQSAVAEHSELAWLFNCVTPLGWLGRMTQFKDKAGKNQESAPLGLLSYPVLMAADILLYKADVVPVGDDQKQHLELTRDIAGAINRKFDREVFKLPLGIITGPATRIMSLKDGLKKMSKSDESDLSRINLNDDADQIFKKIRKAKTDSEIVISYDQERRPEVSNLINIYSALSGIPKDEIVGTYQVAGMTKFKDDLTEIVVSSLKPLTLEYNRLILNEDYLLEILKKGAEKAQIVAKQTLQEVKELFGFI